MPRNSVDKLIVSKAIRKVKQTCKGCDIEAIGDKADCGGCYTGVIISTLEKRIPADPVETEEAYTCAKCGHYFGDYVEVTYYCPKCGQRQDI